MQPVRLLQTTNKFKQIQNNGKIQYIPVGPNASGSDIKTMSFMDLKSDELIVPKVTTVNIRNYYYKADF